MPKRKRLDEEGGNYFTSPSSEVEFFPSGCTLLDLVIGGGYPLGRVVNIVGDKSTGKTLLAIEACANFAQKYPKGKIYYNEVEAAFDKTYAAALGLPLDRVQFVEECFTVEDLFRNLCTIIKESEKTPTLYIIDSLDALSDEAEKKRDIGEGTFGAKKAAQMSVLFRTLIQGLSGSQITIFIISQVRDNIGVVFGKKYSRSGGRALDFYASVVLYLSQKSVLKRTQKGIERPIGVEIKVKCEKNKISLPFRECEFPILFGYGVHDFVANLDWLDEINQLKSVGIESNRELIKIKRESMSKKGHSMEKLADDIAEIVQNNWREIEIDFLPGRTKYGK